MVVEYAVVIRRQFPKGQMRWQLWLGPGMAKEDPSFLSVMNHAGAIGFEAVAAGHFDELGVPEVLLQRRMEMPVATATAANPAPAETQAAGPGTLLAKPVPGAKAIAPASSSSARAAAKPASRKKAIAEPAKK